jgi:ABC-type polysaccharide/polyol phosphate export permease
MALFALARRDLLLKYGQSTLGFLWLVLQPLGYSFSFWWFFHQTHPQMPLGWGEAMALWAGLVGWYMVSRSIQDGSTSIFANRELLTKVACPLVVLPMASVMVSAFDTVLLVSMTLLGLTLWQGVDGWTIHGLLSLGLALGWFVLLSSALALWGVTFATHSHDIRMVLPFAMQIMLLTSPLIQPVLGPSIRDQWLVLYHPLTAPLLLIRHGLLGTPLILELSEWVRSALLLAVLWIGGAGWFQYRETSLMDRL